MRIVLNEGNVYTHWLDTGELITRLVELLNKWIRGACYNTRV